MASGCPMVYCLTELNNYAYVRDHTMFIKIIVDTTDLREVGSTFEKSWQSFTVYFYLKLTAKKCAKKRNARAG